MSNSGEQNVLNITVKTATCIVEQKTQGMTFLAGLEHSIAKKGQPNTVRPMLHWAKTNKPPATAIDCMERGDKD